MSDPLEHATGLEKYELLAKQAGNDVSIKFDNKSWAYGQGVFFPVNSRTLFAGNFENLTGNFKEILILWISPLS